MKKFLEDLIARKKTELADLEARMKKSEDLAEVRSLGDMLLRLRDEITDAEKQLYYYKLDDKEITRKIFTQLQLYIQLITDCQLKQ